MELSASFIIIIIIIIDIHLLAAEDLTGGQITELFEECLDVVHQNEFLNDGGNSKRRAHDFGR